MLYESTGDFKSNTQTLLGDVTSKHEEILSYDDKTSKNMQNLVTKHEENVNVMKRKHMRI